MAKDLYDKLMERYLTNQVGEEERILLDAWLDKLVDKKIKDLVLTPQEKEELYHKIVTRKESIESIKAYRPASLVSLENKTRTLRIAASVVIIVLVGFAAYRLSMRSNAGIDTNSMLAQQVKKMTLQDGSLVWVHGSTEITYEEKPGERHVEMKGEALFEVAKNPSLPFIIHYNEITVKVYGTSFSLKTGDRVELKVLTGRVQITSVTDSVGVMAGKEEKVIYTAGGGFEKTSLKLAEAKEAITNTEYDMYFEDATLGEVLNKLKKKFDVTVNLVNPQIAECRVRLNITDNSLEDSLKKITAILLNVEYKIDGSAITLTGTGCK